MPRVRVRSDSVRLMARGSSPPKATADDKCCAPRSTAPPQGYALALSQSGAAMGISRDDTVAVARQGDRVSARCWRRRRAGRPHSPAGDSRCRCATAGDARFATRTRVRHVRPRAVPGGRHLPGGCGEFTHSGGGGRQAALMDSACGAAAGGCAGSAEFRARFAALALANLSARRRIDRSKGLAQLKFPPHEHAVRRDQLRSLDPCTSTSHSGRGLGRSRR